MPSPTEVAALQNLLSNLSAVAVSSVATLWNSGADSQQLKDAYPVTIDPYVAASGTIAAEWYDGLDPAAAFATEPAPLPAADVLSSSVGWAYSQLDPLAALTGSTERHVFGAARDTVVHNAKREGVRYARYASANACPWCRVLATRGAVYHTDAAAVKGHDNCHCLAVPERAGNPYVAPDYVKQWGQDYASAREQVGGNLNDIVNHMRRTA